MEEMSIEAKAMAGVFCIKGQLMLEELSFKRPKILTPQARKGLDDLVKLGYLYVEGTSNLTWKPTNKMRENPVKVSQKFLEENRFSLTSE